MARPMPWLKPAVLTGSLLPLVDMLLAAARGTLGANPVEEVLNRLGLLALVLLLASLALTPLQALFGWAWPARIRRWVGNLAFTYALLHLLTYAVLDQGLAVGAMLEDVTQRPFILFGFTAFLLLIPLAATSTDAMVKRLGYKRWKLLHRLAYLAGGFGLLHFFLRVKADLSEPLFYAALLAVLFGVRLWDRARKQRLRAQRTAPH